MKVGDVIFSTKVRPYEKATIVKADVVIKERNNKNGSKKKETRSTYKALYSDGSEITFYGFNINKSIFKFEEPDGQLNLSDFMCMPE